VNELGKLLEMRERTDCPKCSQCGERWLPEALVNGLCIECLPRDDASFRLVLRQVPPRYRPAVETPLHPAVAHWHGEPWSVVVQGVKGTGKSWTGTRLWWENVVPGALWCDWLTVAEELRAEVSRRDGDTYAMKRRLCDAPLLLLDDVRATLRKDGEDTDFVADALRYVICQRYDWMRPTILTMDRPLSEMEPRLVSRLTPPRGGLVVVLDGRWWR
jgi:hypothetical protein